MRQIDVWVAALTSTARGIAAFDARALSLSLSLSSLQGVWQTNMGISLKFRAHFGLVSDLGWPRKARPLRRRVRVHVPPPAFRPLSASLLVNPFAAPLGSCAPDGRTRRFWKFGNRVSGPHISILVFWPFRLLVYPRLLLCREADSPRRHHQPRFASSFWPASRLRTTPRRCRGLTPPELPPSLRSSSLKKIKYDNSNKHTTILRCCHPENTFLVVSVGVSPPARWP